MDVAGGPAETMRRATRYGLKEGYWAVKPCMCFRASTAVPHSRGTTPAGPAPERRRVPLLPPDALLDWRPLSRGHGLETVPRSAVAQWQSDRLLTDWS